MKISIIAAALALAVASQARGAARQTVAADALAPGAAFSTVTLHADAGVRFATTPRPSWAPQDPADSLYRLARQAINDQDYARAASLFRSITTRYPKSQYAGDALYWRAYALYRGASVAGSQADLDDALAALDRERSDYPNAATIRDGRELRAQILAAQARRGNADAGQQLARTAGTLDTAKGCPSEDDDERVIALQGLMQMDAESAIPILKQVLARRGACTERLRRSAVFILSQKRGDEPMRIMLDVARNDPSPEVRAQAIQWLGQSRSELATVALDSILFSTNDPEIRDKAIFALSQQRDPRAVQAMRRFAEDEKQPTELRAKAIFWLGQQRREGSDNPAYFRDLFRRTNEPQIREAIIQAMGSTGQAGAEWLVEVARDKSYSIDVRKKAIFWASQERGADVTPLVTLYDQLRDDEELGKQVLFALSQKRDDRATDKLMEIASKDPNRELRKQAIFWLGQRKDPRVSQFLLELINR